MDIKKLQEAVKKKDVDGLLRDFHAITFHRDGADVHGMIKKNNEIHKLFKNEYDIMLSGLFKKTIKYKDKLRVKFISIWLDSYEQL